MIFKNNNSIEKKLLCDTIEQYINIANVNNNMLDDYVSIIAFIIILKKQYPKYSKSFDYYLNMFNSKGFIKYYNNNTNNIAKKYFSLYENNINKAEEIINGFIPNCSNRFINYMIGIGICGKPIDKKRKLLLAKAYSWNSYVFANQAIYYTDLSLNDNKNDTWLLELNGYNYLKIKDYDKALKYYKKALKKSNNSYLYKKIVNIYKRKKDLDGAISFLSLEKHKKIFNRKLYNIITKELNHINKLKQGIHEHTFPGFDSTSDWYNTKFLELRKQYTNIFENHRNLLEKYDLYFYKSKTTNFEDTEINNIIINLIFEDLNLFPKLIEYYKKLNDSGIKSEILFYGKQYQYFFKERIQFCKKIKRYNDAIKICQLAIEYGFKDDGTKSGMSGRITRLLKEKQKILN